MGDIPGFYSIFVWRYTNKKRNRIMAQEQTGLGVRERVKIREPHKWVVIFWNDDFTTMDFVVEVLTEIFLKPKKEAESIMMKVHEEGQAVVGTYSYDIAASRTNNAINMAREAGFPLKITYEEV